MRGGLATGSQRVTIRFPHKGVDAAAPLSAMPNGSASDMLNLFPRAQDAGSSDVSRRRYVGGKRPGLTKSGLFATDPQKVKSLFVWDTQKITSAAVAASYGLAFCANGVFYLEPPYTGGWTQLSYGTTSPKLGTFAPLGNTIYTTGAGSGGTGGTPGSIVSEAGLLYAAWSPVIGAIAADLCCAYRGRVCIAHTSGPVFAMSAVGSGIDFNFASTALSGAYQGNATGAAGVPGDRITALIPFGDEYLIFGGASSMWKLRGDPRYGGRVDALTLRVGVLSRVGWCFDAEGTLWFVGSDFGLWRLPRGSMDPTEVLGGRGETWLARALRGSTTKTVQLVYDVDNAMVLVLVVPIDGDTVGASAEVHVAYSPALDGVYPFSFPVGVPPFCAASTDDGKVFFGGAESAGSGASRPIGIWTPGTQKVQDWNTNSDAEENYTCLCRFAVIEPDGDDWLAMKLEAVGSHNTGSCSFYWLTARSADEVQRKTYSADYEQTGTLFGSGSGYQVPIVLRQRGAAHQLVIAQTANADLRLEYFRASLRYQAMQRYGA